MKAPFGAGDVVVCVRGGKARLDWKDISLTQGGKYIVQASGETNIESLSWVRVHPFYWNGVDQDGLNPDRFRLYEPPKQPAKTTIKEREDAR